MLERLMQRRTDLLKEKENIDKEINEVLEMQGKLNQKIQELVGLKNVNLGLVKENQHWIEEYNKPGDVNPVETEKK